MEDSLGFMMFHVAFIMEVIFVSRRSLMVMSSIVFYFHQNVQFDGAFLEVSLSSYWEVLTPTKYETICSKYVICVITFYECTFSSSTFYCF